MDLPLVILAFLAMTAGFLGVPEALGGHNILHHWLNLEGGVREVLENENLERLFAGGSVLWALLCTSLSIYLFTKKWDAVGRFAEKVKGAYTLIYHKYYVDEIYDALIVKPLNWFSRVILWKGVDAGVIDGIGVNGSAKSTEFIGRALGLLQNGMANSYALYFVMGMVLIIWWVIK